MKINGRLELLILFITAIFSVFLTSKAMVKGDIQENNFGITLGISFYILYLLFQIIKYIYLNIQGYHEKKKILKIKTFNKNFNFRVEEKYLNLIILFFSTTTTNILFISYIHLKESEYHPTDSIFNIIFNYNISNNIYIYFVMLFSIFYFLNFLYKKNKKKVPVLEDIIYRNEDDYLVKFIHNIIVFKKYLSHLNNKDKGKKKILLEKYREDGFNLLREKTKNKKRIDLIEKIEKEIDYNIEFMEQQEKEVNDSLESILDSFSKKQINFSEDEFEKIINTRDEGPALQINIYSRLNDFKDYFYLTFFIFGGVIIFIFYNFLLNYMLYGA